jgi:hypothetical protein
MNTKIIVVVVLILVIFLLYRNIENSHENMGNQKPKPNPNPNIVNSTLPGKGRYIRIEGGPNFAITEVEVIDMSGNNILKPENDTERPKRKKGVNYSPLVKEVMDNYKMINNKYF